jgi:class 3 adenylate cyclase/DNA-binding CsgD family transcriptional regulator
MQCPHCQRENPLSTRFCQGCGQPIDFICPTCKAANPADSRFCGSCGTRLAPLGPFSTTAVATPAPGSADARRVATGVTSGVVLEGERRQTTVLFCQIVDAPTLAARLGPEAMLALVNRFFELALAEIRRYEGSVNRFHGDGFMALFGTPVAYEDHARRAVLAALGVQRRLRELTEAGVTLSTPVSGPETVAPIQVRVGLNTGLVVIGRIGDSQDMHVTAVGDTTDVAAELQRAAEPGTILMSEATARQVVGYVRSESIGSVPLVGKSEPMPAYKVLGVGPRRSPLERIGMRPLTRFVGRQREMAALHDLLSQVELGPAEDATHRAMSRFVGRDHELAALHQPLAQVEAGRGQVVGLAGEPGMGKSRLLLEFRRSLADRRVTYLEGRCLSYGSAIPYLPLLDLIRANCGILEGDSSETVVSKVRFGLQEVGLAADEGAPYLLQLLGVREAADALAALSPEAIKARTFETLRQWSLKGSLRRPIILAVEDLHWIDGTSEEYLASLVECLAGAPILLLCTWRPGYRPPWTHHSYVTQLALRRLSPEDSLSIVTSVLQTDQVPAPLAEVILERAEGNPFFLEELSKAVAEHGELQAGSIVPDTVQGVLMARIDRLPELPRRVLQTASVLGREFSLRLLNAVWDGPGLLAPHLEELKRLEFVFAQTSADEPVYVFKHALTQDVAYESLLHSRRQALHAAAGRALESQFADRLDEVVDRLAYHYAKTDDAVKAVEYQIRFAEKAAKLYANVEASRALEQALPFVERLPVDERERRLIDVLVRLARSYYFLGSFRQTVDALSTHQDTLDRVADPLLAGPFFFELAHAFSHLGDGARAVEYAKRSINEASRAGDEVTLGKAHYVLCKEGMWAAQFPQGIEHAHQAVELLEPTTERWWLGQSQCWQGINLYFLGELDAALACAARGLAIGEGLGDYRLQSYAWWNRAWFAATRGDGKEAIAAGQRSLELSPDPLNTAFGHGWTGYAYLENGDFDPAVALLEQAIRELGEMRYTRLLGWFNGWLAEAYLGKGDLDPAAACAYRGLEISRDLKFWWAVGLAQRARGYVAQVRGDRALAAAHLNEALATFESIQSRFDVGRTHLALGELALLQGRRGVAVEHRDQARDLFRALGVQNWVERANRLLEEAQPATPATSTSSTVASLTAREREVVALLARGLSNQQIAAALVISERTADGHVSNILGKLGLASRTQVAVWAVEHVIVAPNQS